MNFHAISLNFHLQFTAKANDSKVWKHSFCKFEKIFFYNAKSNIYIPVLHSTHERVHIIAPMLGISIHKIAV